MSIVNTASGPVEGTEDAGLQIFKGIPFAAAPVGPLRWAAPQPPEPWSEPLAATEFGAQSLQSATPMAAMFGGVQEQVPFSEDCLSLNIWTRGCDDDARPVMVWIHGGAFIIGSGSSPMYDGAAFANRDVVLVSISVDPGTDIPARLKKYAKRHGANPGWIFLTGGKRSVDRVLRGIGAYVRDYTQHAPAILVGDGRHGGWTRYYEFPNPDLVLGRLDELREVRLAKAQ